MNKNAVANGTLIIHSHVEYRAAPQTLVLRYLLGKLATGQRRGVTAVEDLQTILRAKSMDLQS